MMDLAPAARSTLRFLAAAARLALAGLQRLIRATWTHRRVVCAVMLRVAWWASLWLAIETASALVDVRAPLDIDGMLLRFGVGLGLCWAVVVFASATRLRRAGLLLGTVHGAGGLLLWTASGGAL
ncbi:MAG: hypothetical protein ACE37F_33175 [Nannocystaceae bacterium]|nr:hypothetical protein [bacterium]